MESAYINRELSWLAFNERVLGEALDASNPIFERLRFLSIVSSNLDEFFMVRVAGLETRIRGAKSGIVPDGGPDYNPGETPEDTLEEIAAAVREMTRRQHTCFRRSIIPALRKRNVVFPAFASLSAEKFRAAREHFEKTLYPILTPMAVDQSRPFPRLASGSINLLAELESAADALYAVIPVPGAAPRFISVAKAPRAEIIFIEDIIKAFAGRLFGGYRLASCHAFRVTRDAEMEIDEEYTDDLLSEIQLSVKKRRWGEPARLEIETNMPAASRAFLQTALGLSDSSVYYSPEPLDMTILGKIANLPGFDSLRFPPAVHAACAAFADGDFFGRLRRGDVLLHHPYESFGAVVDFVRAAASDPGVLAIKQTLYRVSGDSPIVAALISAAENGKQVTVLLELKARFDEENNINWARKLEKYGVHVVYGLVGLKTHCKLCLVARREGGVIRRYTHLGTGNYNDQTARLYTDMGLFTCRDDFGEDAGELFNVLTGYSIHLEWRKFSVAPTGLRDMLIEAIGREAENARRGLPSGITAKINSLADGEIIRALCHASAVGVRITLIVRGVCCLLPGIPGESENITVVSLVGRFLEHSRVYMFENGGDRVICLSSADLMPRNLDRRVEVAFPVEDESARRRIENIIAIILSDNVKLRVGSPDGTYAVPPRPEGAAPVSAQELLFGEAERAVRTNLD